MNELCCKDPCNVKRLIESEDIAENLADFYKTFSEPIRIKILFAMLHQEMCVGDLAELLGVSQPRISNQLKQLKLNKIVKTRKEKNNIFYSLDDKHIEDILCVGLAHTSH